MRTVQEIFNVIIEQDIYNDTIGSLFMCPALKFAKSRQLISEEEKKSALEAIHEYFASFGFSSAEPLVDILEHSELPNTFEDTKAIYLAWDKRPALTYNNSNFKNRYA